ARVAKYRNSAGFLPEALLLPFLSCTPGEQRNSRAILCQACSITTVSDCFATAVAGNFSLRSGVPCAHPAVSAALVPLQWISPGALAARMRAKECNSCGSPKPWFARASSTPNCGAQAPAQPLANLRTSVGWSSARGVDRSDASHSERAAAYRE